MTERITGAKKVMMPGVGHMTAPKVKTLQSNPEVALTIDGDIFPYTTGTRNGADRDR